MSKYFELLYEAHAASEEVDNFDLHSDDPKSVEQYMRLEQACNAAQVALANHIRINWELFRK